MKWIFPLISFFVRIQFILSGATVSDICKEYQFQKLTFHNDHFYIAGKGCLCKSSEVKSDTFIAFDECAAISDRGHIKVLVAYDNSLIICGTGLDGTCEIRKLNVSDLNAVTPYPKSSDATNKTSTAVATDDKDRQTVAVTGWSTHGSKNATVLYTATYRRENDTTFVLLSIRNLEGNEKFELFKQKGVGSQIELTSDEKIRRQYYEEFDPVASFTYNGFVYFFANQLNPLKDNPTARVIRLCQNDMGKDKLLTYMDAKMECEDFKKVVDVISVPVTNTKHDHAILGIFQNSQNDDFKMCMFTFEHIDGFFFKTARPFNLTLRSYLDRGNSACNKETSCNREENCRNFIGDNLFIISSDKPLYNSIGGENRFTSFTASTVNGGRHTVALIATENKDITKILVDEKLQKPIGKIPFQAGNVKSMKIIDNYVYILTKENLTKHLLYDESTCSSITNKRGCLTQPDPFCGWCTDNRRCSGLKDCAQQQTWMAIMSDIPDVNDLTIGNFTPSIGPVSGGTLLTFFCENFNFIEKNDIEIFVGSVGCEYIKINNGTTMQCLTPRAMETGAVNVTYRFKEDTLGEEHSNITVLGLFTYMEDPTVSGISPNRSFASGGRSLTVSGTNFDVIQNPRLQIVGENISEGCDHSNRSIIVCKAPEATKELKEKLENQAAGSNDNRRSVADVPTVQCGGQDVLCVPVEFKMDGVNTSLLRQTLEFVRDPTFHNFTEEGMTKNYYTDSRQIVIRGDRMNISASAFDFDVAIGRKKCDVLPSTFSRHEFHCLPPLERPETLYSHSENPEVQVSVGYISRHVGFLRYIPHPAAKDYYQYLYIAVGILVAIVMILFVIGILLRRRNKLAVEKLQNDMMEMELRIKTEFRQAFADLQTDMTDITGELVETGLPYNRFPVYAFQILFPADDVTLMTSHKIFKYPETSVDVTDMDTAMSELDGLFSNKFFVLSVISTMEQQKKMSMSEKSSFAAFLAATFLQDLNYFSQITTSLLEQFVKEAVEKKKHKSLFRRCESITEKLTTLWLEIALHQHILTHRGGSALIMLVKAMQIVMEKYPIDAVTDAARATLSYDQLLLSQVDNDKPITLTVQINGGEIESPCPVLECDTIAQVKVKCLGVMYKKDPASTRPKAADVDLQWHCGKQGRLILQEEDTVPADDNHVKLMTLADYHVTDGSVMELLNKHPHEDEEEHYINYKSIQNHFCNSDVHLLVEDEEEDPAEHKKDPESTEVIKYHLVKPQTEYQEKSKVLAEVHLHKLLQTKMNIKQFVDEVFDSALDKKDIPVVVKYLFTVLETLATSLGVDQDTLLSWKNNSYPIRFWGLVFSRPRIVFDIDTPDYLQPSLDIVASTFIDSFSPPQTLSKNSSPHKLLFFKDLEEYRTMVKSFHRGVSKAPDVDERGMAEEMQRLSYMQSFKVNRTSVFFEIFQVLVKFKEEIMSGLGEDKDACRLQLGEKFEHVIELMDS